MITIKSLSISYDHKVALDDLSVTFEAGKITGLIGPNGAGKSTLLKTCIGLLQEYSGEIFFEKRLLKKNKNWVKKNVVYAPENAELLPYLTGKEFLSLICRIHQLDKISAKIGFFIELLELDQKQDELINSYSHGMKQKLAVAAALISEPKYVLLDESLNGMDSVSLGRIFEYLKTLCDKGILILLTSHNVELIHRCCEEVFVIHKGKIISDFSQKDLQALKIEEDGFLKKYIEVTSK